MSRYVDAEYIKAVMLNDRLMQGNAEFTLYAQQVETQVNALPSIEIIRCGECKYWEESQYYPKFMVCTYVKGATFTRQHDDFCSRGERKDDE